MSERKATHVGILTLAGVDYECAVLNDHQRVIAVPSDYPGAFPYRTPDGEQRHGVPADEFGRSLTVAAHEQVVRKGAAMLGVPDDVVDLLFEITEDGDPWVN